MSRKEANEREQEISSCRRDAHWCIIGHQGPAVAQRRVGLSQCDQKVLRKGGEPFSEREGEVKGVETTSKPGQQVLCTRGASVSVRAAPAHPRPLPRPIAG